MKVKKVYVLYRKWYFGAAECGMDIMGVYDTLSYAQEQMWAAAECYKECIDMTDMEMVDDGDENMSITFDEMVQPYGSHGFYIKEMTIETDPEKKS